MLLCPAGTPFPHTCPPFQPYCPPTHLCALQWHPTPVLLPGKSHGRRNLVVHGVAESDTTERLHFHCSLSCIGEGNGNPLQCSCLENPRDGRAWWAAVYGVAQSRTRLKQLSNSSSNPSSQCGPFSGDSSVRTIRYTWEADWMISLETCLCPISRTSTQLGTEGHLPILPGAPAGHTDASEGTTTGELKNTQRQGPSSQNFTWAPSQCGQQAG